MTLIQSSTRLGRQNSHFSSQGVVGPQYRLGRKERITISTETYGEVRVEWAI